MNHIKKSLKRMKVSSLTLLVKDLHVFNNPVVVVVSLNFHLVLIENRLFFCLYNFQIKRSFFVFATNR